MRLMFNKNGEFETAMMFESKNIGNISLRKEIKIVLNDFIAHFFVAISKENSEQ